MEKASICWLPADPAMGGASMLRWWMALDQGAKAREEFDWSCPLGDPPAPGTWSKRGRWGAALWKYLWYPQRVRQHPRAGLYHLLDHSWAHLLDAVPKGACKVATVHDLIPLRYPDGLSRSQLRRWRGVVGKIGQCDWIVADSEATRDEITDLFGISGNKIGVIPLGVDLSSRAPAPPTAVTTAIASLRAAGADMVIGCLGSALGRKNLGVIPPAVDRLAARGFRVAVVRAGSPLSPALQTAFAPLQTRHLFCDLGFLSDEQVDEFYGLIDVQVMPSLYEGFGLPVIEAMAAGVPVVCSNTTSLPGVAGGAALMFDPLDAEGLASCLQTLESAASRKEWGEKGRRRAQGFSWEHTLDAYIDVYRKAL